MIITKELFPNGELETMREENAETLNGRLQRFRDLKHELAEIEHKIRLQKKRILDSLPYKKGTIVEVFYPNTEVGFDRIRIADVIVVDEFTIDFHAHIIKYTKRGFEKKNLRKVVFSDSEFARMDKTIISNP